MTTNTTQTPSGEAGPDAGGPRVGRSEMRDLARLRRSSSDRKIAGVAGGLARHFDIDPLIPRVALVVLAFFGGAGILIYGACWLILPSEDVDDATVPLDDRSRAIALSIVGVVAALALVGDSFAGWGFPWPLATVGAIVLVVLYFRGRRDAGNSVPAPPQHWGPPPAPASPAGTEPGSGFDPTHGQTHGQRYGDPSGPTWPTAPHASYPPPLPRRRGPLLFWYSVALIAIVLGSLCTIEFAGGFSFPAGLYPATAMAICGVMLVVGAFWGRAGGVIALGLIAALATVGATVADRIDAGRLEARPATASEVRADYDLAVGELVLDLSHVTDPDRLDDLTIEVTVDIGRASVIVPDGVDVTVDSEVSLGERRLFGATSEGNSGTSVIESRDLEAGRDGTAGQPGAPSGDVPHLRLDVTVGLGVIDIQREGETR
ncbi:PspC domain-containing protein [Nocardioides sp. R-C-SC26]|uniref:PspC domain-containing protein n=1 Tax=Nocardioides sp. R-C-SC26 TaxID=2870414 RepID=UPI001E54BEAB|nr:PspC domain-containing protein [Nocardioides sp. R-C-SC26]